MTILKEGDRVQTQTGEIGTVWCIDEGTRNNNNQNCVVEFIRPMFTDQREWFWSSDLTKQ